MSDENWFGHHDLPRRIDPNIPAASKPFFTTQDDLGFCFFPTQPSARDHGLGAAPGTKARQPGPGPGPGSRAQDQDPGPRSGTRTRARDSGPGPGTRDSGPGPGTRNQSPGPGPGTWAWVRVPGPRLRSGSWDPGPGPGPGTRAWAQVWDCQESYEN